jgi:hypothetical protein
MTTPRYQDREQAISKARSTARRSVIELARDAGAEFITRPLFHGADTTTRDIEPLPGLSAARELELAARYLTADYARQARQAGYTWHQIGTALNLTPGADPDQAGYTIAEAAFTHAAGNPDSEHARRYGRTVGWTCTTCDGAISDHGPETHPQEAEHGHARGCARLARTIQAWDAEWEAGQ